MFTPEELAMTFRGVLPPKIFAALAALPHVPNECKTRRTKEAHWLPVLDPSTRTLRQPSTLVEQVVQYVYCHVLPFDLPDLCGVEWWTHSRAPREKMHFHFDRDEFLWEEQRVMKHPTISSVFYITDAGGATLVLNQRYGEDGALIPAVPESGYVYEPECNCLATFSGDLLHGVLPSGRLQRRLPDGDFGIDTTEEDVREGNRRITLLMNWWCDSVTDKHGNLTAELSQEERWAYGAANHKLKWGDKPKRLRQMESEQLQEEVRLLYTHSAEVDCSSSEDESSDEYGVS